MSCSVGVEETTSPTVLVTNCEKNGKEDQTNSIAANEKCLVANRLLNESFSESDR